MENLFKNEPKILSIQELPDIELLKSFEKLKQNKNSVVSKIYYPSFVKEYKKRGIEIKED